MITNEERIKALRCQFFGDDECAEKNCPYCGDGCMPAVAATDAADALEFLQRVIDTLGKNHRNEIDEIVKDVMENLQPLATNLC